MREVGYGPACQIGSSGALTPNCHSIIIGNVVRPTDQRINMGKSAAVERTFLAQEIAQKFLGLLQE
jgi:hypothetical protein